MGKSQKDQIYAHKQDKVESFVFDEKVASVFSDMIQRSVPGYILLNQLLPVVAKQFIQSNSNIYDLGCSLGEASISLARSIVSSDVKIIAIDNSRAMINHLDELLAELKLNHLIETKCKDILNVEITDSSFVVLNYTLQFIDKTKREGLLNTIYKGLQHGGALLLSEKITHDDANEDKLMEQLHENYKRKNDYSDLEISQKREALDNVLIRETHDQHLHRLQNIGFTKISILCKYLNFVTYLAIKE
ncbi:MAG: carboxy-S-adenosyl-L-methionine synthase CmoA [Pseudomonadota bacterium]